MTTFAVGSLVRARGREWVVLPESAEDLLIVRPLGGSDADVAGLLPVTEPVEAATFPPPTLDDAGNASSAALLRSALQVGFRAAAGPFRAVGDLGVEPRPYQLVPLLMALRQDPVRLLIADDVGVGKTVEAGLIAAELIAQGSTTGLTVLCGPALAEQWQRELAEKFGLDAELVLPSTIGRLERELFDDESVFDRHRYTVVSTDFIKNPRRRDEFSRSAPALVVVDEAHTCVAEGGASSGRTQRYDLLRAVADDAERHIVLVTATPHSGKDEGFRNLVGLLHPELATVDLATTSGREQLARHMVQRRRGDIRRYLDDVTAFPDSRETQEQTYYLADDAKALFRDVLAYARETVRDDRSGPVRQRVRYWAVLGLLRALASSPAAAAATLRSRARVAGAEAVNEADALGRASVLDLDEREDVEAIDIVPGADPDLALEVASTTPATRADGDRLLRYARRAEVLAGPGVDRKLDRLVEVVATLLADGYDPIVFCRFIDTAEYVATALHDALSATADVAAVTGELPPSEREHRIAELVASDPDGPGRHVLVATDCLSEGVNLQEHFQAVVHYDLAWNPTRHEQREGRVDRFGQRHATVRAVTILGADNQIDEIIMRILIRKHEEIRKQLGVSVPVPDTGNPVIEAIMEELFTTAPTGDQLTMFDASELGRTKQQDLHREWQSSADTEKASRTRFAQAGIRPDEVARELEAMREALGSGPGLDGFVRGALDALGAPTTGTDDGFRAATTGLPPMLREALPRGRSEPLTFHRTLPVPRGHAHLGRADTTVTAIARHLLHTALDPRAPGPRPARRCGVVRTRAVTRRTTVLLVRLRFHLSLGRRRQAQRLIAEDAAVVAFQGRPDEPDWLEHAEVDAVLRSEPSGNLDPELARDHLERALSGREALDPALDAFAGRRAEELAAAHRRVRSAGRAGSSATVDVGAHTPVDVLGLYVFLPEAP